MCPGPPQVLNFIFLSLSRHKPECSVSCVAGLALLFGTGGFHTSVSPHQCVLGEPQGRFPPFLKRI